MSSNNTTETFRSLLHKIEVSMQKLPLGDQPQKAQSAKLSRPRQFQFPNAGVGAENTHPSLSSSVDTLPGGTLASSVLPPTAPASGNPGPLPPPPSHRARPGPERHNSMPDIHREKSDAAPPQVGPIRTSSSTAAHRVTPAAAAPQAPQGAAAREPSSSSASASADVAQFDAGLTEALLRQIRQLEGSMGSVLSQREDLVRSLDGSRSREESLRRDLEGARRQLGGLQREHRDLKALSSSLVDENKRLTEELSRSVAESARLQSAQKQMSEALQRARTVLVETGQNYQRLQQDHADLKKELARSRAATEEQALQFQKAMHRIASLEASLVARSDALAAMAARAAAAESAAAAAAAAAAATAAAAAASGAGSYAGSASGSRPSSPPPLSPDTPRDDPDASRLHFDAAAVDIDRSYVDPGLASSPPSPTESIGSTGGLVDSEPPVGTRSDAGAAAAAAEPSTAKAHTAARSGAAAAGATEPLRAGPAAAPATASTAEVPGAAHQRAAVPAASSSAGGPAAFSVSSGPGGATSASTGRDRGATSGAAASQGGARGLVSSNAGATSARPATTNPVEPASSSASSAGAAGRAATGAAAAGPESPSLLAERLKSEGNRLYQQGKHQEAIETYAKAIDLLNAPSAAASPSSAPLLSVLHGNRAAAFFALQRYTEALYDCTVAEGLHPAYLKVLFRRAECWAAVGDYGRAIEDLQRLQTKDRKFPGVVSRLNDLHTRRLSSRRSPGANHYRVLGLTPNATGPDVRTAYKSLARRFHPDKAPAGQARDAADLVFKTIAEAHAVLSDPQQRRIFDVSLLGPRSPLASSYGGGGGAAEGAASSSSSFFGSAAHSGSFGAGGGYSAFGSARWGSRYSAAGFQY